MTYNIASLFCFLRVPPKNTIHGTKSAINEEVATEALAPPLPASTALTPAEITATARTPCERCLLLLERVETLTEKSRLSERLLEHSEKLLVSAEIRLEENSGKACAAPENATTAASTDPRVGSGNTVAAEEGLEKGEGGLDIGRGEMGGGAGDRNREELLAATEAVWRISEMARELLEGELDRRGEALASARKATREANEALFTQVNEL